MQTAQPFYVFAQMMHLAAGAGAGIAGEIGRGMGMGIVEEGVGGMPIPTPVAVAAGTPAGRLGAAVSLQSQVQAGGPGGQAEIDPVIARYIAAANTKYENGLSLDGEDPQNLKRKYEPDHDSDRRDRNSKVIVLPGFRILNRSGGYACSQPCSFHPQVSSGYCNPISDTYLYILYF